MCCYGGWLILKDGLLEHIRGCFKNSGWITTKAEDVTSTAESLLKAAHLAQTRHS